MPEFSINYNSASAVNPTWKGLRQNCALDIHSKFSWEDQKRNHGPYNVFAPLACWSGKQIKMQISHFPHYTFKLHLCTPLKSSVPHWHSPSSWSTCNMKVLLECNIALLSCGKWYTQGGSGIWPVSRFFVVFFFFSPPFFFWLSKLS